MEVEKISVLAIVFHFAILTRVRLTINESGRRVNPSGISTKHLSARGSKEGKSTERDGTYL